MNQLPRLPSRAGDAHKGDFGRVLVLAGSTGMVGAAALAGEAALRSGAGLVTIGTPESVYPILAAKVTCCLTRPLPETSVGTLAVEGMEDIREASEKSDVVAIGPGLGRHESTTRLVHRLVLDIEKPMVLDADALNAMAENSDILKNSPASRILTPHPGEMSRLTGLPIAEIQSNRSAVAHKFASEHNVVLLLKGSSTVVSDGERVYVNSTGNPGMASGGTGDVLTGLIAALAGQGMPPFEAAVLGAYLHGLAGDIAAGRFGQVSLIATDLLSTLPEAFQRHRQES